MIKVEKGEVHMKGGFAEIITDLTFIIKGIREQEWFEERILENVIENSKLTVEQIQEKLIILYANFLKNKQIKKINKNIK